MPTTGAYSEIPLVPTGPRRPPLSMRRYHVQRHDGIGGSLGLALTAAGFASTMGWRYGGALAKQHQVNRSRLTLHIRSS